jgi:hypothetical protein
MNFTPKLLLALAALAGATGGRACDLCAISSADNARPDAGRGWVVSANEQFIHYGTLQLDGAEVSAPFFQDDLQESMTHLVAGYNFSARAGISLNLPYVYRRFTRTDFDPAANPAFTTETGKETGIGDLAMVGRVTVLRISEMEYSAILNVLGGVKFPTGNSDRVAEEVRTWRAYDLFFPPGHVDHDSLAFSPLHEHMLAPGSGSFDGIFGASFSGRWQRAYANALAQYYLRTPGREDFEFGDKFMASASAGYYALLRDSFTASLAVSGYYETEARATIDGRKSDHTGLTAWWVGPQLTMTSGEHFSFLAAVDFPVSISNNGFQLVPDYRVHGGFSWRF